MMNFCFLNFLLISTHASNYYNNNYYYYGKLVCIRKFSILVCNNYFYDSFEIPCFESNPRFDPFCIAGYRCIITFYECPSHHLYNKYTIEQPYFADSLRYLDRQSYEMYYKIALNKLVPTTIAAKIPPTIKTATNFPKASQTLRVAQTRRTSTSESTSSLKTEFFQRNKPTVSISIDAPQEQGSDNPRLTKSSSLALPWSEYFLLHFYN